MRRKDEELDGVWGKGGNGIEVEAERMQTGCDDVMSVRRRLDVMCRLDPYYS